MQARIRASKFFAFSMVIICAAFQAAPQAGASTTGTLTYLPLMKGSVAATAIGLSADGSVIAGQVALSHTVEKIHPFRWTNKSGMVDLGTLGGDYTHMIALSSNGEVVVGLSTIAKDLRQNVTTFHAFRWSNKIGMKDITPEGSGYAIPSAVSADGAVVVGGFDDRDGIRHAFRWTQSEGLVDIDGRTGGGSQAEGVSLDGTVIVGKYNQRNKIYGDHLFRWTPDTGMIDLGTFGDGFTQGYKAMSADGSVIVGDYSVKINKVGCSPRAFIWTQESGFIDMGSIGGICSSPAAISADGSVVVGGAVNKDGLYQPFVWTKLTGMVNLGSFGGNSSANLLSADGRVVVGWSELASGNRHVFRWTSEEGMVDITPDNCFSMPVSMSADGSAITGYCKSIYGTTHLFRWELSKNEPTIK